MVGIFIPFEVLYKAGWWFWDWGYRKGLLAVNGVSSKVISIGNITWGGTGKTPLAGVLAKERRAKGEKTAVLSRGYGARHNRQEADEVRELARSLNGIPVLADPDRVACAQKAAAQGAEILILDDGFQHRRLARQFDLVVIDATDPFGNGHLIPAGKLREPPASLKRADWIIVTKTDLVPGEALSRLKEKIGRIAPGIPLSETIYRPVSLSPVHASFSSTRSGSEALAQDDKIELHHLKDQNVGLVAAIGNPEAFRRTVEKLGAKVVTAHFKRDHSRYSQADWERLAEIEMKNSISCWVTTSKDAVKIRDGSYFFNGSALEKIRTVPIFSLEIELVFTKGEKELWQAIDSL